MASSAGQLRDSAIASRDSRLARAARGTRAGRFTDRPFALPACRLHPLHRRRGSAAERRRGCRSCGMVNFMPEPAGDTEVLALAVRALARARSPVRALPERLVLVDVAAQRVHLIERGEVTFSASASTSRYGVGGDAGSNRTPLG